MKRCSMVMLALLLCVTLTACGEPVPEGSEATSVPEVSGAAETMISAHEGIDAVPEDSVFVAVTDYVPDIQVDLKYASEDNFTGQVVYDFSTAYLRYGTVKKLAAVQADLKELGLGLKIWDGFRPVSAQYRLWEICPDPRYVADPEKGFSSHSRGNTVDVTLVDSEGKDLLMPTGFDDFSALADRDYSDCTAEAANNAEILEILMEKHGFSGYRREWWHYTDTTEYPVEEIFLSE